jgi:uncharacterized membrane protein YgcG
MNDDENNNSPWKARAKFAAQTIAVLLLCTFLLMNGEQKTAIAKALRDPMSILAGRSPGARGEAALRQTKLKPAKAAAAPALKAVLGKDQVIAPEALAPADPDIFAQNGDLLAIADPFALATHDGAHFDATPGDAPLRLARVGGFVQVVPGGATIGGGGGTGGGGSGGGGKGGETIGGGDDCGTGQTCTTPTGEPTPPPMLISVPEPGTWLLIILGFFSLGGLLRNSALIRSVASDAASAPRTD